MRRNLTAACVLAATWITAGLVAADSDEPLTYDVWFDGLLQPHPENPSLNVFLEGDSLTAHVDPTRLFPDPDARLLDLGFPKETPLAEVNGFYVVGPGAGIRNPLSLQPGLCGLGAAESATKDAKAMLATQQQDVKRLAAKRPGLEKALAAAQTEVEAAEAAQKTVEADAKASEDSKGKAKQAVDKAKKTLKKAVEDKTANEGATKKADQAVFDAKAVVKAAENEEHVVVTPSADGGPCVRAIDWRLNDARGVPYICHGGRTLGALTQGDTDWSLVQRSPKDAKGGDAKGGDAKGDDAKDAKDAKGAKDAKNAQEPEYEQVCLKEWHLEKARSVAQVTGEIVHGANTPESVVFAKDRGVWATTFAIKRNTREIRLAVKYEDGTVGRRTLMLKTRARDSHSLVRVQGEILATNRLRVVSFAVAVSPVSRQFFTDPDGPSWHCLAFCRFTPMALLRLSGDDKTVVQFGGGVALNLVRAFQVNAGLLFGSSDASSAWRIERNWFVGIAIDPLILSEVVSTNGALK